LSVLGVVLAGRRAADGGWEGEAPLAGRPLAFWPTEALRAVPGCERVAVVGPSVHPAALVVPPGASLADNLRRGVAALRPAPDDEVLAVTGDAALVTSEALAAFLAASRATGAAVTYPVVPQAAMAAAFPGSRRTYVRVADGTFTGGNACYLRPQAVEAVCRQLEALYAARKNPLRLAAFFGLGTVLALLAGRARIARLEAVAARRLGLAVRAVVCPQAVLGVDVDKPEDYELCAAVLGARGRGGAGA
jgi:2-phospho-L-lactate guanylyltransferase (CobY/MobA/RfbA family)